LTRARAHAAVETKLSSRAIEGRDSHGVIEDIVEPAKTSGIGSDLQARAKEPEVVTFARPEHHPVLAKFHGLRIPIDRDMAYGEEGHG
jgi:hypothetical protein